MEGDLLDEMLARVNSIPDEVKGIVGGMTIAAMTIKSLSNSIRSTNGCDKQSADARDAYATSIQQQSQYICHYLSRLVLSYPKLPDHRNN